MQKTPQRISLFKWIWRFYQRTALIPLVFVGFAIIAIYFATTNWSKDVLVQYLNQETRNTLVQTADREANSIQQQLLSISHATELFRRQVVEAFSAKASLSNEDASRLAYSPKGIYYTTRDKKDGGAAIFYSGFVPVGEKERAKVANLLTVQKLLKNIKESEPLAAAVYFNTFDSLNIIYPYFDVLSQYPPLIDIPSYNFYYLADRKHNPERKIKWTDVYLDPAGQGWMTSAIAPVYRDDFLEGVVGIDVTVNTIINQVLQDVLENEFPYQGYAVLIGQDGSLLALPPAGESDWGLSELTDHHYSEAVKEDTFKPDQFNLKKRKGLESFSNIVFEKRNGFSVIHLQGEPRVVTWSTIDETGWKLAILVSEKNIFAQVNRVSNKLFFIGTVMIAGLALFFVLFVYSVTLRARKMSREISQPLVDINGIAQRIGEGRYSQQVPDLQVEELYFTAAYLVEMGKQLGAANNDLLATQDKLKIREGDLHALVNAIEDIIIKMDGNGTFLNMWIKDSDNPFQPAENIMAESLDGLFDQETAEGYKNIIRQVIDSGQSASFEFGLSSAKGARYFLAKVSLIDKDAGTVVVCARDISDRVAMEKALIAAKEEAEKASQAKSQFLSSMSHELRTPLNAVLGFAQLLEMEDKTPLTESQRNMVEQIQKAGDHLLDLINEVLDLSLIESGKLKIFIGQVKLKDAIEDAIALIRPIAEKNNISINYRDQNFENIYVQADKVRIKQVLLNILSNAVKYNT
ncbi:MAG: histidine kinase [Deltaproteobacteria bacterium]|nr:histidine kinase [Deltaproteobacteria bacterium]